MIVESVPLRHVATPFPSGRDDRPAASGAKPRTSAARAAPRWFYFFNTSSAVTG